MNLIDEFELLSQLIKVIPEKKKYWLVRTQSGDLYETFRTNEFIALEHYELSLSELNTIRNEFGNDYDKTYKAIRSLVEIKHEVKLNNDEEKARTISLIASQICRFVFEVKKGDIVIIPSKNSDNVSFGTVLESHIGNFNNIEILKSGVDSLLKKRVEWLKEYDRERLEPDLFRIFTAHQALNDINYYAQAIERTMNDLYVLNNEAHVIINVGAEYKISAKDLFGFGYEILESIDEYASIHNLEINSQDLNVTINLNSPGKIDLKSTIKKTTLITAIIVGVMGGGLESKKGQFSLTSPGISGILKSIDEFKTHNQERRMRDQIFSQYKDSLQIKTPDDMIKLLKQFSENKDLPK